MSAAPWANPRLSGMGTSESAGTTAWSAKPPKPTKARTRSPSPTSATPGPTAETSPAISLPGTNGVGGLSWYRPWQMSPST